MANPTDDQCQGYAECVINPDALLCQPGGYEEYCRLEVNSVQIFGVGNPLTAYVCANPERRLELVLFSATPLQLQVTAELVGWLGAGGHRNLFVEPIDAESGGRVGVGLTELPPVAAPTAPAGRRTARVTAVAVWEAPDDWHRLGTLRLTNGAAERHVLRIELDRAGDREIPPELAAWLAGRGPLRVGVALARREVALLAPGQLAATAATETARSQRALWSGSLELVWPASPDAEAVDGAPWGAVDLARLLGIDAMPVLEGVTR